MEQTRTLTQSNPGVSRARRRSPRWTKNLLILLVICLVGLVLGAASLVSPLLALALALGMGIGFAMLRQPMVLAYLVVAGIALGSGMARGALVPQLKPNELILIGAVGASLPVIILQRMRIVKVPVVLLIGQGILIVGTVVLPLVAYPVRGIPLSFSDQFTFLAPAQFLLLFLLFTYLPLTDDDRHKVFLVMIGGAIVIAIVGLLQAAKIGPVLALLTKFYPSPQQVVSVQIGRITSLLGAWNGLGTFFTITLLLLIGYLQVGWKTVRNRTFLTAGLVICGFGLLASGSFAGIIGLVTGLIIMSLINRTGLRTMAIVGFVLLLAGALLSGFLASRMQEQFGKGNVVPSTLAYRFFLWQTIFIPLMEKYWLWGFQPNFANLSWQWAESQYLFLMLTSGIFSLLAHLTWVGLTLFWLSRRFRSPRPFVRSFAVSLFAILIALSIMGFTNEVFTYSGVIDYIWIGLGLLAGYQETRA